MTLLNNTINHGILGKNTTYPKTYAPDILYPIARALGRERLLLKKFIGVDYWHIFELSWLNSQGISQVAMARIAIPAHSEFIVESKSLKLYFNSLNFTVFNNKDELLHTIKKDLSDCLKLEIQVELFELSDTKLLINQINSNNIDNSLDDCNEFIKITSDVDNGFLADDTYDGTIITEQDYYSNLLRSNCPVTNQPDWGTVQIKINGGQLNTKKLLKYILSYRNHNGFHEQCVEQIFDDLMNAYQPKNLMVRAWYTRRGGIDINPIRVSDESLLPSYSRLVRQ